MLPALIPAFLIGPIEELGWRDLALPLCSAGSRRCGPHSSSVWLRRCGTRPLFHVGTKHSWSFGPFFVGVVAISVILTPMLNAARGSLLVAALFHARMNGPAWPDAQPWDTLGFVVVAALVVWVSRHSMLTRGTGATERFDARDWIRRSS